MSWLMMLMMLSRGLRLKRRLSEDVRCSEEMLDDDVFILRRSTIVGCLVSMMIE